MFATRHFGCASGKRASRLPPQGFVHLEASFLSCPESQNMADGLKGRNETESLSALFARFANRTGQAMPVHNLRALLDCGACLVHDQATLPLCRSRPKMLVPFQCILGVLVLGCILPDFSRFVSFAWHRRILGADGWFSLAVEASRRITLILLVVPDTGP